MPATVSIESAGSHCFDMPHLRRSGAEDLIQLLLEKAGYYEQSVWRVRVNEKQQCSGMTPPISVVRYKEWGVYLRIKPGDNNTCHNVTLIIPNGFKANEVYHKLKTIEKSFNRNWRKVESTVNGNGVAVNGSVVDPMMAVPKEGELLEVNTEVTEPVIENERFDLQAFLSQNDNIKAVCLCIHSLEAKSWRDTAQFMSSLCTHLSITLSGRQGGAKVRSMMNRGLAKKTFDGVRHVGYALTRKGKDTIKDDLNPPKVEKVEVATEPPTPKPERSALLREIGPIAKDISHASARLKEISAERLDYQKKIEALDKEEREICELVDDAEIEKFLSRLVDIKLRPK